MSIEWTGQPQASEKLRLSFTLPNTPLICIGAVVCWRKSALMGFQFQDSDPERQVVKDWINSLLGLN